MLHPLVRQMYLHFGPHNYEILCILIGSLLGDGYMEKDGMAMDLDFVFIKKEIILNM